MQYFFNTPKYSGKTSGNSKKKCLNKIQGKFLIFQKRRLKKNWIYSWKQIAEFSFKIWRIFFPSKWSGKIFWKRKKMKQKNWEHFQITEEKNGKVPIQEIFCIFLKHSQIQSKKISENTKKIAWNFFWKLKKNETTVS